MSQALHAFRSFIEAYPDVELDWYTNSNFIAILAAKDESELKSIIQKAIKKEIKYSYFREPDLNNEITAIAVEPGRPGKKLTSYLPLALKGL